MMSPVTRRRLNTLRSIPKDVELSEDKVALQALYEQLYDAIVAGQSLDDLGKAENKKVMDELDRLMELFDRVKHKLAAVP